MNWAWGLPHIHPLHLVFCESRTPGWVMQQMINKTKLLHLVLIIFITFFLCLPLFGELPYLLHCWSMEFAGLDASSIFQRRHLILQRLPSTESMILSPNRWLQIIFIINWFLTSRDAFLSTECFFSLSCTAQEMKLCRYLNSLICVNPYPFSLIIALWTTHRYCWCNSS